MSLNVDYVDVEHLTLQLRGKRSADRQVPLPEQSVAALRSWLGDPRGAVVNRGKTTLFVNHRGNLLTRRGFWIVLKSYASQVGIEEIIPHTLRHAFGQQTRRSP